MVRNSLAPSQIITPEVLRNAIIADMALGSTNSVLLLLLAIAHEVGMSRRSTTSTPSVRQVPHICNVSPSGAYRPASDGGGRCRVLYQLRELLTCLSGRSTELLRRA